MTEQQFIFDPHNKVDHNYGYYMFFGSILSFIFINIVVTKIGPPKNVKGDPWRWNNLFISWIHAAICGTWDILCLVLYPEMLDDLVYHINYFTYLMVAFSTGYFVYDFLDLMYNGKLRSNWEVTIHHVAMISIYSYNTHTKMCIAYTAFALCSEVNSIFLHARKLLKIVSATEGYIYNIVCALNILSFIICRFTPMFVITHALFTVYDKVPRLYHFVMSVCCYAVMIINIGLFYQLVRSDYHFFKTKSAGKKFSKENSVNENNGIDNNHFKSE